jgi:hypothetical protein
MSWEIYYLRFVYSIQTVFASNNQITNHQAMLIPNLYRYPSFTPSIRIKKCFDVNIKAKESQEKGN